MRYLLLVLFVSMSSSLAGSESPGCLPDSGLRYEVSKDKGMEERELLDEVIGEFKEIFSPYVKDKTGKKLKIINEWENSKVNAHATKDNEDNLVIILNGGMARHPDMKKEGLYFILCHELGHFFGGSPKQFRGRSDLRSWSSAEGQADYFASKECLPKVFSHLASSGAHDNLIADPNDQKEVDKICGDRTCSKVLLAGLSATKVFSTLKPWWKTPSFQTPNRSKVGVTNLGHPEPQCRLDTVVLGALRSPRPECWFVRK